MEEEQEVPPVVASAILTVKLPNESVIYKNKQNRWVYCVKSNEPTPLTTLGPFGTRVAELCLDFFGTGMYQIIYSGKLQIFANLDVCDSGTHGPIAPVTLDDSAKRAASIPLEATHFCWCYPPTGIVQLTKTQKESLELPVKSGDPEFTFLAFGGFVYFKYLEEEQRYKFLRANALVQAQTGLTFEGPFKWDTSYTSYLYREGRFEDVTISGLNSLGLKLYCFINPGEQLKSQYTDEVWSPCPNGGFVYLYNSDGQPHPLDRYFHVAADPAQVNEEAEIQVRPFSVAVKSAYANPDSDFDNSRSFLCSICLERTVSCIYLPCRHISNCSPCAKSVVQSSDKKCPLCRRDIENVFDVYL
eukprot:TRINITY_DN6815_c0_g1_i1.p1 TRINITY_DN6815_c0_g1~~TRINITY_DN6815_c0_g1_i1.p1  ORF type:complete len:358 (-),score=64.72 TRINITY_DN6815_c0_g1_i1:51-1124(-)